MHAFKITALSFVAGLAGAVVGESIIHGGSLRSAHADQRAAAIRASSLELVDANGRRQAYLGTSGENSPTLWFYDNAGKARLSIGLYGDGNATVALNDPSERAVELVRSVGPNAEPVLVQKQGGQDRIILGLMGGSASFVRLDEHGVRHAVSLGN